MMRHRPARAALGALATWACFVSACQWMWPNDARYDPKRCADPCAPGFVCQAGACVSPEDGGLGDASPVPPPAGAWAVLVKGSSTGHGIAIDQAGNSYVIGTFTGMAQLGAHEPLEASESLFVAKLDRAGKVLWAFQPSGGETKGHDIAVDAAGEQVQIAATFRGEVAFGPYKLSNKGADEAFVARLDGDGGFVWAKSAGSGSPPSIALDQAGNCYAAGSFTDDAVFGGTDLQLAAGASRDLYLAKLDGQGAYQWARQGFATDQLSAHAVAASPAGDVFVTGDLRGKALLGETRLESGQSALFVAKLTAAGTFEWAIVGAGRSGGSAIAVDADDGDVFITGYANRQVSLGSHVINTEGQASLVVARLDGAGRPMWLKPVSGSGMDLIGGSAVGVSPAGLHLAGSILAEVDSKLTFGELVIRTESRQELFVALLSYGGVFRRVTTVANALPGDIAPDSEDNTHVVGTIQGAQRFGQTPLVPTEESHAVIGRINADGEH